MDMDGHPSRVSRIELTPSDEHGVASLEGLDGSTVSVVRLHHCDQTFFESVVEQHADGLRGLDFWKCPLIHDLTPLEDLSQLTHVSYYWNQRVTGLWDISKTPMLVGLRLRNFTKLRSLEDLQSGSSLNEFFFDDAIEDRSTVESFAPLTTHRGLRSVRLWIKNVLDGDIEPLAPLQMLEQFDVTSGLFTTEQFAWLRSRAPEAATGSGLTASHTYSRGSRVSILGRRKPRGLDPETDAERIERYCQRYEELVRRFSENPKLRPSDI